MSLTEKLRELAELDREMKSEGLSFGAIGHVLTSVDIPALLTSAERLEAQNARLRELVRSAYVESWGELSPNEYREEYWEKSAAKAALAALDKEGSDA